jgi:ssDNA-binding Zn-finger/Zn-ribbon topoisomerase 1
MAMLDRFFSAYTLGVLQSSLQILVELERNHLDSKAIQDYLDRQKAKRPRPLKCPKCGSFLGLASVNSSPRTAVGGNWKSMVFCTNWKNCGYERYSTRTVQEELKELRRKQDGLR